MSYIYQPKGKAGEYGDYALNLYNGCSHGCLYCYVPGVVRKTRENFNAQVLPRKFDWDILEEEILNHSGNNLFLCFTCDPYQPENEKAGYTRKVIEKCHGNNVRVILLTKAGNRSAADFELLSQNPDLSFYGATLTFMNETDSWKWEPAAALPEERIATIEKAHNMGIPTWVSLEPVIDPAQSLEIIKYCHPFVDEFKVGKWNHSTAANEIDWRKFGLEAVDLLEKYGKKYYIKKDLADFLNGQNGYKHNQKAA